jgi:hypothetical protein
MVNSQDFSSLNLELLAEQCSNETKKFFRGAAHEARYCFELLCRACRDGLEAALSHIYSIYLPILAARARRHAVFAQSSQDADSIARIALSKFYLATKAEKFLEKFTATAQAVAYMYTCVHTAVLEDVQGNPPSETDQYENIPSPTPPSAVELQDLWAHICSLLPDDDNQLLARLRFVLEMKPAEISQHYPEKWETPRKVSIAMQYVRRRLRDDPYLRELADLGGEAGAEDE